MKILFSGGGTLGPVVPLLAIKDIIAKSNPSAEFVWVGTSEGPERTVVEAAKIPFFTILSGKWRRYWSLANIIDIFKIIYGFFQSWFLLGRLRPTLVVSCGGFVSVPLHWAARVRNIPAWVHQQDVEIGLANKLMLGSARIVTTALETTATELSGYGARFIGNPCRNLFVDPSDLPKWYDFFKIPLGAPVILVVGGGTGALALNNIVLTALPEIPSEWQVIHLVGTSRPKAEAENATKIYKNYHVLPFLGAEIIGAYALAQVVVARAGMGTLTELAALSKPAIIFPKSETHQEANARWFGERKAVLVLNEKSDDAVKLSSVLKQIINHPADAKALGERLHRLLPTAKSETIISLCQEL